MSLAVEIRKDFGDFKLDVNFVAGDEIVGILGASGSGKSMTLRCIAGIVKPDEGRIVVDDRVLFDSVQKINLSPQERRIGLLFQDYALFPNMTVRQNLLTGLNRVRDKNERAAQLDQLLRSYHLAGLEDHHPNQLSGGQKQRVAVARIMAGEPTLLMLDEPFSALDEYLSWRLERELTGYLDNFAGTTLYVSHNRDEVFRLTDKALVMDAGVSQPLLKTRDLFDNPTTLKAALISGCKNFSAIRRHEDNRVFALDWNVELQVEKPISQAHDLVGIHAHDFHLTTDPDAVNLVRCVVAECVEELSGYNIMLQPESGKPGSYIRLEISTREGQGYTVGDEVMVTVDPDKVMLLKN